MMDFVNNALVVFVCASLLWEMWTNRNLRKMLDAALINNTRIRLGMDEENN